MLEIVFDTDTTGIGADEHRIIEIGMIELDNRLPTGRTYHQYINPEREIDAGALRVHGITQEQVANEPRFIEIVDDLLEFVGNLPLVAHNASFDMAFINTELQRCGKVPLENDVVDTLALARKKLPGGRHSLDALCRHYEVDLTVRKFHGALLDAQLLAEVYVELMGGLQGRFELNQTVKKQAKKQQKVENYMHLVIKPTEEELANHKKFISKISEPLWEK